jgi:hypothetical protein
MTWCAWLAGPVLLGALLAVPVSAQEVRSIDGILVVTGGVGSDERSEMMMALPDYNLKVVAAARRSGEYLGEVALEIRDTTGKRVLGMTLEGPWLLARLPAGTYELRLTHQDKTQTRTVGVPAQGKREAYFYWDLPQPEYLQAAPEERAPAGR